MPINTVSKVADTGTLTSVLNQHFNNSPVITIGQFREFLGISKSTDAKMRRLGQYPRIINLPGHGRDSRLIVADVVAWLESGGCNESSGEEVITKKRGRPVGSRNRPKEITTFSE